MKTRIAILFVALSLLLNSSAQAQGHERREHERERFRTPHWVLDNRFHHNHYYPSVGYSLTVLPTGNIAVTFRSGRYFFHSGVWYQPVGAGYVVVRPPIGVVVPILPPAYTTVWVAGIPYYYANDAYYVPTPGGYAVAAPPMVAAAPAPQTPPPPAPAPQAAPGASAPSGTWYFCESAKAYYPYVSECKEGWRQVPASPPR